MLKRLSLFSLFCATCAVGQVATSPNSITVTATRAPNVQPAALLLVSDWALYNNGYTGAILNLPQNDPDAYRRSSPIFFANGLKGALLICHGMVDTNVEFKDTVRLVQKLIKLRTEKLEPGGVPRGESRLRAAHELGGSI